MIVDQAPKQITTVYTTIKYESMYMTAKADTTVPVDSTKKELIKFRDLFKKVVEAEAKKKQRDKDVQPKLKLQQLIIDNTRSKLGRDFYTQFYQNWVTPDSASNFTITILEQPAPGLGSLIMINIDYIQVFKARLQPRMDYIKAVSNQAINRCQEIVAQQAFIKQQLTGF